VSCDRAQGWLACIARDPDDVVGEPALAIYCPACAAREELAPEVASFT
jgi:hypothetical protein